MCKNREEKDLYKQLAKWPSIIITTIIVLLSIIFVVLGCWFGTNIVEIVAICCLCALGICGMICATIVLVKLFQSRKRSEPSEETMDILRSAYKDVFSK